MTIVYIVRDVEERYIQGVYVNRKDAESCITEYVEERMTEEDDTDYADMLRDDLEILEMPLE